MNKIDLNCDVGEGVGNEAELMPYISSCNISCGAHAGTEEIIKGVILLAEKHHVKIGAHPSYPDRENFGRKKMNMPLDELEASLISQIKWLNDLTTKLTGSPVNHVKAHGALYNSSAIQKDIANVVVNAVIKSVPNAKIYVPNRSVIEEVAFNRKLKVVNEVFADRNYQEDLSLVPRTQKNAIITNKNDVVKHVIRMVKTQKVKTLDGIEKPVFAETCCVHGDNEKAVEIVKFLHESLLKNGVSIE
jgi:UPF0271 protein